MTSSKAIKALFDANRLMVAETREIPVAVAVTFLAAALFEDHNINGEPLTLEDLAARVGVVPSTMSSHLRYIGEHYRYGKPGLGLVETDIYKGNRRRKVFSLTPKGRALIVKLEAIIRKAT